MTEYEFSEVKRKYEEMIDAEAKLDALEEMYNENDEIEFRIHSRNSGNTMILTLTQEEDRLLYSILREHRQDKAGDTKYEFTQLEVKNG